MAADAHYILGHSDVERRRLEDQAEFMDDLTRRCLIDAGLRSGMRILDVGSGFGDVSLLAASIVGSTGEVLGVERDATAVTQATARAARLGARNVAVEMFEHYGVATAAELDVDTLEGRLRAAVTAVDSTVALPSIVAAWARI